MVEIYFKVVIDEETEAENIQSRTGEIYTEISEMCDKLNQLSKENEQLKQQEELISEQSIQLDYLKDENRHMSEVLDENKQLKQDLNKKMKFVAKQESESTVQVDFDEFVQLCKDSNNLKEKEERIKELEKENQKLRDELKKR